MDCERVLTKKGERLARITIVNYYGNIVLDTLVKPWCKVLDFREEITGIKASDMNFAPSYPRVAPIIKEIINNRIIVGHSLEQDFLSLNLTKDEYTCETRDIAEFSQFLRSMPSFLGQKRKLKDLAREFLNADIQKGHHSSVIDARAALALYRSFQ